MARPSRRSPEAEERARAIVQTSDDSEELRIAQAVLLPASGLSLEETAQLIGRDRFWVTRERNRFIKQLPPRLKHGGRRTSYLDQEEEHRLLMTVLAKFEGLSYADYHASSLREMISAELYRTSRMKVADSTLTDLLNRYTQRFIPGATWGELGWQQSNLTRLAAIALKLTKRREEKVKREREKILEQQS